MMTSPIALHPNIKANIFAGRISHRAVLSPSFLLSETIFAIKTQEKTITINTGIPQRIHS